MTGHFSDKDFSIEMKKVITQQEALSDGVLQINGPKLSKNDYEWRVMAPFILQAGTLWVKSDKLDIGVYGVTLELFHLSSEQVVYSHFVEFEIIDSKNLKIQISGLESVDTLHRLFKITPPEEEGILEVMLCTSEGIELFKLHCEDGEVFLPSDFFAVAKPGEEYLLVAHFIQREKIVATEKFLFEVSPEKVFKLIFYPEAPMPIDGEVRLGRLYVEGGIFTELPENEVLLGIEGEAYIKEVSLEDIQVEFLETMGTVLDDIAYEPKAFFELFEFCRLFDAFRVVEFVEKLLEGMEFLLKSLIEYTTEDIMYLIKLYIGLKAQFGEEVAVAPESLLEILPKLIEDVLELGDDRQSKEVCVLCIDFLNYIDELPKKYFQPFFTLAKQSHAEGIFLLKTLEEIAKGNTTKARECLKKKIQNTITICKEKNYENAVEQFKLLNAFFLEEDLLNKKERHICDQYVEEYLKQKTDAFPKAHYQRLGVARDLFFIANKSQESHQYLIESVKSLEGQKLDTREVLDVLHEIVHEQFDEKYITEMNEALCGLCLDLLKQERHSGKELHEFLMILDREDTPVAKALLSAKAIADQATRNLIFEEKGSLETLFSELGFIHSILLQQAYVEINPILQPVVRYDVYTPAGEDATDVHFLTSLRKEDEEIVSYSEEVTELELLTAESLSKEGEQIIGFLSLHGNFVDGLEITPIEGSDFENFSLVNGVIYGSPRKGLTGDKALLHFSIQQDGERVGSVKRDVHLMEINETQESEKESEAKGIFFLNPEQPFDEESLSQLSEESSTYDSQNEEDYSSLFKRSLFLDTLNEEELSLFECTLLESVFLGNYSRYLIAAVQNYVDTYLQEVFNLDKSLVWLGKRAEVFLGLDTLINLKDFLGETYYSYAKEKVIPQLTTVEEHEAFYSIIELAHKFGLIEVTLEYLITFLNQRQNLCESDLAQVDQAWKKLRWVVGLADPKSYE